LFWSPRIVPLVKSVNCHNTLADSKLIFVESVENVFTEKPQSFSGFLALAEQGWGWRLLLDLCHHLVHRYWGCTGN
jgi:hypothetical protein